MSQRTTQKFSLSGIVPSFSAADAAGDQFANTGKCILHVKNGGASAITVTIASQISNPPAGTIAQDQQVTVAAGSEKMIGPFPQSAFNDENGQVHVSYSGVTSVTIAVFEMKF